MNEPMIRLDGPTRRFAAPTAAAATTTAKPREAHHSAAIAPLRLRPAAG